MESFKSELLLLLEILDGTKNVNIYGDIFGQPIIDRLNKASNSDILNMNNYYQMELQYQYTPKKELIQYLKQGFELNGKSNGFFEDFMQLFKSFKQDFKQKDNKKAYSCLSQFFIIFHHFNIKYDISCYTDLINCIQEIPNYGSNYSHEDRIAYLLKKLINTLFLSSSEKIVCRDENFFQYFSCNYFNLRKRMYTDKCACENSQICQEILQSNNDEIIIEYSIKVIPLDKINYCLQYIAYQKDSDNKRFFIKKCLQYFREEMVAKNGWNKLYYELYDIILMKMRLNQDKSQIIGKDQQQHVNDEEISSSNINLIQMIMSEIKLKVNQYNKQFAKFGIILNPIGERCIYYYSMFLIWRFSCYNKWRILNKNYGKLESLKSDQYKKCQAAIKQNQFEQSQIKANLFAKSIYSAFIEEYYQKNNKNVLDYIETRNKKCFDIIKEQDKILLEQYQANSSSKQQQEVLLYITDQKKYIDDYSTKVILNIKDQINKEQQEKLKLELQNYFYILKHNINLISIKLQTQEKEGLKTIDYFEKQGNQQLVEVECEQELFKIVKSCVLKEKSQNPNEKPIKVDENVIKKDYKEIFEFDQFQEIPFNINVTLSSPQDETIQRLKPYIQGLLNQITKYFDECKNEKLNIDNFHLQNALDKVKLNMIGCQESCPLCKRKCDQPNNNNHKHLCQNGHQLRGMNYVLFNEDYPSLFACEEITDDMVITTQETSKTRTWKQIKQMYKDWDFQTIILQNDENYQKQVKDKMNNVWNGGIGKLICEMLSKKYNKTINYITKQNFEKNQIDRKKIHYIFMLDDSGSMSGTAWQNAKKGALTCMEDIEINPNAKVSVIIFNSNARVVIDCEKVNIKSQHNMITFQDGGTNFENAFQSAFDQIKKHEKEKFEKTFILFYTDGGDSYPENSMKKFISLPSNQVKQIQLTACSEETSPSTLSLMVSTLKKNGFVADLKTNVKLGEVQKIWSEVVLKGVHVSD